jgi:Ca2+-binding RTX toxin-like protein
MACGGKNLVASFPITLIILVAILSLMLSGLITTVYSGVIFAKKHKGNNNNNNNNNNNKNNNNVSDDGNNNNSCINRNGVTVIIGTRTYTKGTPCDDDIVACPMSASANAVCYGGDTLRGQSGDDTLQGSTGDDSLYGDDGKDSLIGADGNDKIYGGQGSDVLFGGFGSDLLVAGPGNDELYAGPHDDVLIGGPGADYFDCGDGQDVILDFNPAQGDTHADNCEVILNHNPNDISFVTQKGIVTSNIQSLGIGTFRHPTDIDKLGNIIRR